MELRAIVVALGLCPAIVFAQPRTPQERVADPDMSALRANLADRDVPRTTTQSAS